MEEFLNENNSSYYYSGFIDDGTFLRLQECGCYTDRQSERPRSIRKSGNTLARYERKSGRNDNGESVRFSRNVRKKTSVTCTLVFSFGFLLLNVVKPFDAYAAGEAE